MIAYRTQAELEAGLAKWQFILHLQDWEITATLVPQTTWDSRTQSGDCFVMQQTYAALIRLATIDTLDLVHAPSEADMERTLVHELLHCIFRGHQLWGDDKCKAHQLVHYEHAIEQTARALVELDRRSAGVAGILQELRG